jgi:hypothetical protein
MASTLGSRPLNPVVEPPAPEPEPEPTPEQAAEQAAEKAAIQQWESDLDGHIEHLKSLDPSSEHFAQDPLDALNLVDHHVGGSAPRVVELRDGLRRGIAAKARADLEEHLRYAETTFPPGVGRSMAALHGFGLHLDQLDPVEDAELIAFGRQALGLDIPQADDDGI